jgi:hypothetical protein
MRSGPMLDRITTELAVIAAISFAALCLAWRLEADYFAHGLPGGNGTCGIRRAQPLAMNRPGVNTALFDHLVGAGKQRIRDG